MARMLASRSGILQTLSWVFEFSVLLVFHYEYLAPLPLIQKLPQHQDKIIKNHSSSQYLTNVALKYELYLNNF